VGKGQVKDNNVFQKLILDAKNGNVQAQSSLGLMHLDIAMSANDLPSTAKELTEAKLWLGNQLIN
jgi:hypothetical protein